MKGGVGVVVVLVAAVVFGCLDRGRGEGEKGPGQLWGDLLGSEIDEEMVRFFELDLSLLLARLYLCLVFFFFFWAVWRCHYNLIEMVG